MHSRTLLAASAALNGLLLAGYRGAPARQAAYHLRNMHTFRLPGTGGVAAIGDSITAGRGARPDLGILSATSWLSYVVEDRQVPYCFNAGVPDQPTEWTAARLPRLMTRSPDVVAVLSGTNDVLQGFPVGRPVGLIGRMIDTIREHDAKPVLGTLPPFARNPRGVQVFNEGLQQLADWEGVPLIDFYSVLADVDSFKPGYSHDGLHPNEHGSRVMGALAKPVLAQLLGEQEPPAAALS